MLLYAVRIQKHFQVCEHHDNTFSKESFIDTSLEKLKSVPKGRQNIFILDLFVKELMLEGYCDEQVQHRRRNDILVSFRGLLFVIKDDLKFQACHSFQAAHLRCSHGKYFITYICVDLMK